MTYDRTEPQSDEERRRAQQLSRQRTRPPLEVPGYEIRQFLGAGAYGEVWVAVDQNTGRRVAIKFYAHRGGVDWALLSREVEKLVFLSTDRYIVQLLDVGWDAEPPYYVMEYVENGSLENLLEEHGPLPVDEAVEMFREIAVGLLHAHGKGVLHCDLKPANILLDQDGKPRLADFGQSRLSHEQSPALGTLFYMAPEQADLEALPDARWDVYALGAMLFRMLCGRLPYRSDSLLAHLDQADQLPDRLARYRDAVARAPRPIEHRQLAGVDVRLADIVDRCLEVDPNDRYPHVQRVLDDLRRREQARQRRPLIVLGILGPLLLVLVMGLFGWRGYRQAVGDSEREVTDRALESNLFAAKFVAEVVSGDLEEYYAAVEWAARDPELIERLAATTENAELRSMLDRLADPAMADRAGETLRRQFVEAPARQPLQAYLDELVRDPEYPKSASWFITEAETGVHLGAGFIQKPPRDPTGNFYGYRTYFHGGPQEMPATIRPPEVKPLEQTRLSAVFKSTASDTWKVAVSTPVRREGETLGVLAITFELGGFVRFDGRKHQFAVLVDGRPGPNEGVVLQHPIYAELLAAGGHLPSEFGDRRVDLHTWTDDVTRQYIDPFHDVSPDDAYREQWLAAKAPVLLDPRRAAGQSTPDRRETGLFVIVQEDFQEATASVHQLGRRLSRKGLLALGTVVLVSGVLWLMVFPRLRGGPSRRRTKKVPIANQPTPREAPETEILPSHLREET